MSGQPKNPVRVVLSDPWTALETVLGGSLHPGGEEATIDLLDRADVSEGTRLLDAGCGAGNSLELARDRGTSAVGLDADPRGDEGVCGDINHLPFEDSAFEAYLSECTVCLSSDLSVALTEAHRVLEEGGRLALSDVTVDDGHDVSGLPDAVVEALCLGGDRSEESILNRIGESGFEVEDVKGHREDLLGMRDKLKESFDYEKLLALMGDRGERIREGAKGFEEAIEEGDVGYVSVVATAE